MMDRDTGDSMSLHKQDLVLSKLETVEAEVENLYPVNNLLPPCILYFRKSQKQVV
jgi:hypothetical protein